MHGSLHLPCLHQQYALVNLLILPWQYGKQRIKFTVGLQYVHFSLGAVTVLLSSTIRTPPAIGATPRTDVDTSGMSSLLYVIGSILIIGAGRATTCFYLA